MDNLLWLKAVCLLLCLHFCIFILIFINERVCNNYVCTRTKIIYGRGLWACCLETNNKSWQSKQATDFSTIPLNFSKKWGTFIIILDLKGKFMLTFNSIKIIHPFNRDITIGVFGLDGAGKSTLVDNLANGKIFL